MLLFCLLQKYHKKNDFSKFISIIHFFFFFLFFFFFFFKKAIFASSSSLPYNLQCSCERRLPGIRPSFWWSSWWSFGLASLTSFMSRSSALLTCSFQAFLLLLTNFTSSCKLHRYWMSKFFILSNLVLPRMALKVFISDVLKSCFVLVVAALVSAPQVIIGRTTALYIFILLSTVTYLFLQVTSLRIPDNHAALLVWCRTFQEQLTKTGKTVSQYSVRPKSELAAWKMRILKFKCLGQLARENKLRLSIKSETRI